MFKKPEFPKDEILIYQLDSHIYLTISRKEEWTSSDFIEHNAIILESDFYDLCPICISSKFKLGKYDEYRWPFCLKIYSYQDFYLICHGDFDFSDIKSTNNIIFIDKSPLQLMAFFTEFCLPYLRV